MILRPHLQMALVVALLYCLGAHCPGQTQSERAKLSKRKEDLSAQIAKEEERLKKKQDAAEKEFAKLKAGPTLSEIGVALDQIAKEHEAGVKSDRPEEAKSAVQKQVRALVRDKIGPTIAPAFEDDLCSNLVDRLKDGQMPTGSELFKSTLTDTFEEKDFAAAWDSVLKAEISGQMKKLTDELMAVSLQLEGIDRTEQARKSGVPPSMIPVPGGSYRIGVDEADLNKLAEVLGYVRNMESMILSWRSTPSHERKIESFFIDQNEVTNAWWEAYRKEVPNAALPTTWKKNSQMPEGWGNRPVTGISYDAAVAFSRWMGRRIPTEFEWEAAARYNEKKEARYWPWGDVWDRRELCNHDGSKTSKGSIPVGLPPMIPVGTYPEGRSALGLNDLVGNAYEMTSSPFAIYPGFKKKSLNGRTIGPDDFPTDQITLRGGDAIKRDIIVTTFSRLGVEPHRSSDYVGFRTASSQIRGRDHVAYLVFDGNLQNWTVDYQPLPSDVLANRRGSKLETDNANYFSSYLTGGWNEETNLPTLAKHLTMISRAADDFRDFNTLKTLAKDSSDHTVMLGYLRLEIPSVEPALAPGDYFVLWQSSHTIDPPPEIEAFPPSKDPSKTDDKAKTASEEKPDVKAPAGETVVAKAPAKQEEKPTPAGKSKDGAKPPGPGKALKKIVVPEALVFERRGNEGKSRVRVENFLPPITDKASPSRIHVMPTTDTVQLVYAFPIKMQQGKQNFFFTVQLKLEEGMAAKLR